MFPAAEVLGPNARFSRTEPCRSPTPTSPALAWSRAVEPLQGGRRGGVPGGERRVELADAVPLLGDEAEVHRTTAALEDRLAIDCRVESLQLRGARRRPGVPLSAQPQPANPAAGRPSAYIGWLLMMTTRRRWRRPEASR